jgi:hypothetical protein
VLCVTTVSAGSKYDCISWRATAGCEEGAANKPDADAGCKQAIAVGVAGYCECAAGRQSDWVSCKHAPFTCEDVCKEKFGKKARARKQAAAEAAEKAAASEASSNKAADLAANPGQCAAGEAGCGKQGMCRWRQTGGCDPAGPRESHGDVGCDQIIPNGQSGYCDCADGRKAKEVIFSHCRRRLASSLARSLLTLVAGRVQA